MIIHHTFGAVFRLASWSRQYSENLIVAQQCSQGPILEPILNYKSWSTRSHSILSSSIYFRVSQFSPFFRVSTVPFLISKQKQAIGRNTLSLRYYVSQSSDSRSVVFVSGGQSTGYGCWRILALSQRVFKLAVKLRLYEKSNDIPPQNICTI